MSAMARICPSTKRSVASNGRFSPAHGVTASKSREAFNCAERSTVAEQGEGASAARVAAPMATIATVVKITRRRVIP